jgi:hypothetical protein
MTISSHQLQACFDAWMNCEDLLSNIAEAKTSFSKKLTQAVDECALICMGTFQAIKSKSENMSRVALLCVGICEECAELLEEQKESIFSQCADHCRKCADSLSHLAFPAAINIDHTLHSLNAEAARKGMPL